jgi:shikimate dehydrogenase
MSHFAVVGDPIAHSKSPRMHAAAYAALGLHHTYEAIHATAAELPSVVARLRAGELRGINVTVPHKARVLDLVDAVAPSAAAVSAANTLVLEADGRVVAHNTDVPALAWEVRVLAPEERSWGSRVALVLGTGGAARAAVSALRDHLGVGHVLVRGRREGDRPLLADPAIERDLRVVVQATSCGMLGGPPGEAVSRAVAWDALPREAVALDVVYSPPETPFVVAARARGLRAANGVGMLGRQGALAFELWLGITPPLDVMINALS